MIFYTFSANFFGGKCRLIGGFWELKELAFRMYGSELPGCACSSIDTKCLRINTKGVLKFHTLIDKYAAKKFSMPKKQAPQKISLLGCMDIT